LRILAAIICRFRLNQGIVNSPGYLLIIQVASDAVAVPGLILDIRFVYDGRIRWIERKISRD
jgi:hypothetical protein